ncbi:MAG: hypothetical protein Q9162_001891 [Coniocarpon cinnabarinum]
MDEPTASRLGQKRPRAEDEEPFTNTIIRETDRALSAYEYGDRDENEEMTPQSSEKHLGGLQKLAKSSQHAAGILVRERIDRYIAQTDQTINAVNSQLHENWNMGLSQGDVAMVNRATKLNKLTMARNCVARLSIPERRIPDPEPARHPELPLENWLVILEPLIERALRDHERVFVHGPCMQRSRLLTTHLHLRNLFAIACMSRDIRNIVRRKILKWMKEVDERDERERFAMERGQRPGSAVRLSEGTLWRMRRRAGGCVARLALPELPPMGELAVEERAERERQREAGGQR